MTKKRQITQADEDAADWIVRLKARDVTEADRAEFERWKSADPAHEYAYRVQEQYWDVVPAAAQEDDYADLVAEPFYERWGLYLDDVRGRVTHALKTPQALGAVAALAFAVMVGAVMIAQIDQTPPISPPDHATQIAEIRALTLDDGSVITLGAASSVDVTFSEAERRVTLLAGEAFFDVAKDVSRPFFVEADDTLIRVVGTKFDVRHGADSVQISVLEGEVHVDKPGDDTMTLSADQPDRRVLTAGQRIVSPNLGALPAPLTVEAEDVAPWREGRLVFVETKLKDVVADVNRYYDGEIILGDEQVGELEFTAALRTDQVDLLIETFSNSMPVMALKDRQNRIVLRTAPE